MSDAPTAGPFHVSVHVDARILNPSRLGGVDESRYAEALACPIQGHAWEAGLEISDPKPIEVSVTRAN